MKLSFSLFSLMKLAQARRRNEEISAKKQDKNVGKSASQTWLPKCHVTIWPRFGRISGQIRGSGEIKIFSKSPANPAKNWPDIRPDSLKKTSGQYFLFFFFSGITISPPWENVVLDILTRTNQAKIVLENQSNTANHSNPFCLVFIPTNSHLTFKLVPQSGTLNF